MKLEIGDFPDNYGDDREFSIEVENYDVYSLDNTLAMIIHPCLVKLKELNNGAPKVSDEDVPDNLKDEHLELDEYHTSKFHFEKWDWVLNELIWTFGTLAKDYESDWYCAASEYIKLNDEEKKGYRKIQPLLCEVFKVDEPFYFNEKGSIEMAERIQNGLRLFAKHYQNLWY